MSNHHDDASESQGSATWVVYVPNEFLDQRMTDQAFRLLMRLESMARTHAYCFPSNELLACMLDKKPRAVRNSLAELESLGWITRTYSDRKLKNRTGIVMRRRIDPKMPKAETTADVIAVARTIGDGKKMPSQFFATEVTPRLNESTIPRAHACAVYTVEPSNPDAFGGVFDAVADCNCMQPNSANGGRSPIGDRTDDRSSADETSLSGGGAGEPAEPDEDQDDRETAQGLARIASELDAIVSWPRRVPGLKAAVGRLGAMVAETLIDGESKAFYCGNVWEVWRGERDKAEFLDALATTVRNVPTRGIDVPGAYFTVVNRGNRDEDLRYERRDQLKAI